MARVVPTGSALSEPFWQAAARGELLSCLCHRCGSRFFIPEPMCPLCGSHDWGWSPSPGDGVVYSFTVVHRSPDPAFSVPYVLAIVDLDDGWTMLTHVLALPDAVRIGARVRVAFTPADGEGSPLVPTFVLAESGQ